MRNTPWKFSKYIDMGVDDDAGKTGGESLIGGVRPFSREGGKKDG
jgi:hypothetical protein